MSGDGHVQVGYSADHYEKGANRMDPQPTISSLPAALEELELALTGLDENLGALYGKLDPLLRPESPVEPRPANPGPECSGIAYRVYAYAEKAFQMKRAMNSLRERIDL